MKDLDAKHSGAIVMRAQHFIDTLDRSALGVFAVDAEALYLMQVSEHAGEVYAEIEARSNFDDKSVEEMKADVKETYRIFLLLSESSEKLHREFAYDDVESELYFWWNLSGAPDLVERAAMSRIDMKAHDRLSLIAKSPKELHAYFAEDIWDVELIERLIADGVDASMASGLVGGAAK